MLQGAVRLGLTGLLGEESESAELGHAVVHPAQGHHLVEVGRAADRPADDVVRLRVGRIDGAPGDRASLVADPQGLALRRRCQADGPSDRERLDRCPREAVQQAAHHRHPRARATQALTKTFGHAAGTARPLRGIHGPLGWARGSLGCDA